ncbi:hypothetical protein Q8A67_006155 [Cirrhinus molitorella]|uniref:Immunoglobulin domain-containing protein n=1 Tax=Cirrhinus molitorella TaxID=172907 RepID=A0AA88Q5N9_9TELE|nr:hypothetical protein Q8A67_006155 [Cirrhinus molitorella]
MPPPPHPFLLGKGPASRVYLGVLSTSLAPSITPRLARVAKPGASPCRREKKKLHTVIRDSTMRIIQLQLYVLFCCQAAVANLLTDLGSNVSINCDLDENEVYWILLKTPDPPTKYSVQFKHRLVINNVTADELGVYYCMNTDTSPKLSKSSRIYITDIAELTECHNHTALEFIDQNQTQYEKIIIIISALMNRLLLFLLIVFAAGKTKRLEKHIHDADLLQTRVTYQLQD